MSIVDRSTGKQIRDLEYLNIRSGELENIKKYEDKIVILNFWSTYCSPCIEELSDLKNLDSTFKNELLIIAISIESPEKIRKFIEKFETPSIVGS